MIYQIRISLIDTNPLIWRQIQVDSQLSLSDLHAVIQTAMGWQNRHGYLFRKHTSPDSGPTLYGYPELDINNMIDDRIVMIEQLLPSKGSSAIYEYDFGDDWQHLIVLEAILEANSDIKYPCCIRGELACPPEDVGGIPGFYEFLEAIGNPAHKKNKFYKKWLGKTYTSDAYSITDSKLNLLEPDENPVKAQ